QIGVLDQRAADTDSLALPAGQLVRALVGHVIETDAGEQPERLVDVGLWKIPHEALPEADIAQSSAQHVLHHTQSLDQRVFLEDHSHAPARAAQFAVAEHRDLDVIEPHCAGGRLDQPVDAAYDSRFSSARRPDERHDLAVGQVEIHALQRQIARAVALRQTPDPKHSPRSLTTADRLFAYLQVYLTPFATSI